MSRRPPKHLTGTEKEQIKGLIASGLTYNATGVELKRDPHTIKKFAIQPEVARSIEEMRNALAIQFENLAERMLTSISDTDITSLSAYQRTLSAAVSVDKSQLLRGRPTSIIDYADLSQRQKELEQQLADLEDLTIDITPLESEPC